MPVQRIGQVALTVADLEGSLAYYRDVLGLPLLFRTPTMAFFDCGGTRLLLGTENETSQSVLLYFFVDDIRAEHARLEKAGARFDAPPRMVARLPDREVWLAVFRDPSGLVHHLMSEVPVTAPA